MNNPSIRTTEQPRAPTGAGLGAIAGPVLRPDTTCWRIARADRMTVIIDGANYLSHFRVAIRKAQHPILLVGWDFAARSRA